MTDIPRAMNEESMADQLLRRVQTLEDNKRRWKTAAIGSGCLLLFVLLGAVVLVVGVGMYYDARLKRQEARLQAMDRDHRALMEDGEVVKVWVAKKSYFPGTEVDRSHFELRGYPKTRVPDALTESQDPTGRLVHYSFAGYPVTRNHYLTIPQ